MDKREKSNIFLSITGMSVSRLGSLIYTFAIGLYVLKLTGSGQSFALTLTLGILPRVLLGPIAGNFADRLNKKLIVVVSDIFSGVLMVLLFLYTLQGVLSLPLIYGTTLLLSISALFLESAFGAAQRDIVNLESLTRLGSLRQSTDSIITLASPMIGGLIYAVVPIGIFLLINGISFFISALSEFFIDFNYNKATKRDENKPSFLQDLKSGFEYFKKDKLLINIGISAMLLNLFLSSISVVIPFAIVDVLGISDSLFGLSSSIMSLGALAGAIFIGTRNSKMTRKHLLSSLFLMGLSFAFIGLSMNSYINNAYIALILVTFFGFITVMASTFINVPMGVFFQTRVEPAYLGRVSSIIGSLCLGVMPLAYILYGMLTEIMSPFALLSLNGAVVLFLVFIMTRNRVFYELDNLTGAEVTA